jgi:hypothetical protein
MKKNLGWSIVLLGVLVFGGLAAAQGPVANISAQKHPDLAEAQQHIIQAYQKVKEAQTANKEELGGHAEKAADLLVQADRELKAAAEYADHRK